MKLIIILIASILPLHVLCQGLTLEPKKERIRKYKIKSETVKEIKIYPSKDTSNIILSKTQYDTSGNEIEIELFLYPNYLHKESYIYDKQGNKIQTNQYSDDGKVNLIILYQRNENGNITEIKHLFENGIVKAKYNFMYDSSGNQIKKESKNYTYKTTPSYLDTLTFIPYTSEIFYEYDQTGKLISTLHSNIHFNAIKLRK